MDQIHKRVVLANRCVLCNCEEELINYILLWEGIVGRFKESSLCIF